MPDQSHGLSLATTTSGLFGGLLKAIADHASATNITLAGAIDVAAYAIISASVGYGVKLTLDRFLGRKSPKR
jgi:hypothetical protein|tara:strand:+ start:12369 stop:12584 length:216 start_codon:yes stop_codon:yes gene_type:complete